MKRTVSRWLALVWGGFVVPAAPGDEVAWLHFEPPSFPVSLTHTKVGDGYVLAAITYDETGRITDQIALGASHPAFVGGLLDALERAQLDASKLDDGGVRRQIIRFDFRREGFVVNLTQREASKTAISPFVDDTATAVSTYPERSIDPPLQTVDRIPPEYPADLKRRNITGSATVSFVVDAEGRVRVPVVTRATSPEFGDAALGAVSRWRFSPPTIGALRVQVLAERTYNFGSPRTAP